MMCPQLGFWLLSDSEGWFVSSLTDASFSPIIISQDGLFINALNPFTNVQPRSLCLLLIAIDDWERPDPAGARHPSHLLW